MFQRPNGHTHHDFHRGGIVSCVSHQLPCKLQLPSPQAINHPLTGRSTLSARGSQSDRDGSGPRPSAWLGLCGLGLPARALPGAGGAGRAADRRSLPCTRQRGSVGAAAPGRRGGCFPHLWRLITASAVRCTTGLGTCCSPQLAHLDAINHWRRHLMHTTK